MLDPRFICKSAHCDSAVHDQFLDEIRVNVSLAKETSWSSAASGTTNRIPMFASERQMTSHRRRTPPFLDRTSRKQSGTSVGACRMSFAPDTDTFIIMHGPIIDPSRSKIIASRRIVWRSDLRLSLDMAQRPYSLIGQVSRRREMRARDPCRASDPCRSKSDRPRHPIAEACTNAVRSRRRKYPRLS
jgi:hypothetical protein